MQKIAIICGGPSMEYEVSLNTANAMLNNIDKTKHSPYILHISKNGKAELFKPKGNKLHEEIQTECKDDLLDILENMKNFKCLLATHGEFGEDGKLQTILEYLDIPYTGTEGYASALCMDKYRSGIVVKNLLKDKMKFIKTTFCKLRELQNLKVEYPYPICIKPNAKGSSVGVYIVKDNKEYSEVCNKLLKEFSDEMDMLVQEAIPFDMELSCGCLEDISGNIRNLPAIEIIPQTSDFFDYNAKYTIGASIEITPPEHISKEIADKISILTGEIHKVLGCRLYSRSDFFVKGKDIYYIETNTLPGMTSTSLLPQEAKADGIGFTELLDFLIENS
jgi:D-alanine-D-alanine ligase